MEYPWTVRTDLSLVRTHAMSIASGCLRRLIRGVLVMPVAAASTACLVSRSRATAGSISFWPQPATARQLAGNVVCVIAAPRRPISLTIGPLLSCVDVGYHFILVGVVGSTALLTPLCRRSLRSRGPRLRVNALRGYHTRLDADALSCNNSITFQACTPYVVQQRQELSRMSVWCDLPRVASRYSEGEGLGRHLYFGSTRSKGEGAMGDV